MSVLKWRGGSGSDFHLAALPQASSLPLGGGMGRSPPSCRRGVTSPMVVFICTSVYVGLQECTCLCFCGCIVLIHCCGYWWQITVGFSGSKGIALWVLLQNQVNWHAQKIKGSLVVMYSTAVPFPSFLGVHFILFYFLKSKCQLWTSCYLFTQVWVLLRATTVVLALNVSQWFRDKIRLNCTNLCLCKAYWLHFDNREFWRWSGWFFLVFISVLFLHQKCIEM